MAFFAQFVRCSDCQRLNTKDALNMTGRCVCQAPPGQPPLDTFMGKLAAAHFCEFPGDAEQCSFGGIGCHEETP